jgi:hypothetical protein
MDAHWVGGPYDGQIDDVPPKTREIYIIDKIPNYSSKADEATGEFPRIADITVQYVVPLNLRAMPGVGKVRLYIDYYSKVEV